MFNNLNCFVKLCLAHNFSNKGIVFVLVNTFYNPFKTFVMKRNWLLSVSVLCLLMMSCTKEPLDHLTEEESRIYVTNYDNAANFGNYATFRLADSVAIINNNQLQGRERTSVDAQLIDAVAATLQQRGYTRVGAGQAADLGITLSAITNTSTQIVSYPDYGGYYGSYWDPYYWGYPGSSYYYPTYYGVYESNETALTIDVVDLKNRSENNNTLRVVWSGLVRGSGIFSGRNAQSQIDALFAQSPYFKK